MELLFKPSIEKARAEIKGVMSISMIKMTSSENGKDVLIVYKEDSDKKEWLMCKSLMPYHYHQ